MASSSQEVNLKRLGRKSKVGVGNIVGSEENIFIIRKGKQSVPLADRGNESPGSDSLFHKPGYPSKVLRVSTALPQPVTSNEDDDDSVTYAAAFEKLMYRLGMSLCNPDDAETEPKPNWRQMVHFIANGIISTMYGLSKIKLLLLNFDGSLKDIIILGYFVNRWLFTTSHILKTYFRQEKTRKLHQILSKSKLSFPGCYRRVLAYIFSWMLIALAFIRSGVVTVQTKMDWPDWTLEDMVQYRSYELGYNAMVWTKNASNETEEFVLEHFFRITPMTVLLALISFFIDFVGILHEQVIKGSIVSNAATIYTGSREFSRNLKEHPNVIPGKIPVKIWKNYRNLVELSKEVNDINGMVHGFLHSDSFLIGAYFLDEALKPDIANGLVFMLAYEIIKISGVYTMLAKSTSSTEDFKKWIMEHHADCERLEIDDGSGGIRLHALLDELNDGPIGVKTSNVIVNSAFNVQFVGAVVYYFLLLVDANSKEDK